jgi:hypothetical protein
MVKYTHALALTAALIPSALGAPEHYAGYFDHPNRGIIRANWKYGSVPEFEERVVNTTWSASTGRGLIYENPLRKRSPTLRRRAFSIQANEPLWSSASVPFKFGSDADEAQLSSTVKGAMAAWQSAVPCLKFPQQANSNLNSTDVLTIYAGTDGCYSTSVGADPSSEKMVVLQPQECDTPSAVHEFGHVLGLFHENQRPDADKYIKFHCENIDGYPWGLENAAADSTCCKTGEDAQGNQCGMVSQFLFQGADKELWNQNGASDLSSPYDLTSIMHYPSWSFAAQGKITLEGAPDRSPSVLSSEDIFRINELYCGAPVHRQPRRWRAAKL